MRFKGLLKKQFLLWIGSVLCLLLLVSQPGAETENTDTEGSETNKMYVKIDKNFKNPKLVKTIARVMEVNTYEFYIVIAEDIFYVAKFKINGKTHMTELTDAAGNKIDMDAFSERDPVAVTAIEMEPKNGKYVALKIEILPPR